MDVEVVEGHLRQAFEECGQPAGRRVGLDRPDQLRVDAESAEDHEQAVLIPGLRFADVDGADQRPVERRSAE